MVALIKPSSGSRHWPQPREAYAVRSTGYTVHRPTHPNPNVTHAEGPKAACGAARATVPRPTVRLPTPRPGPTQGEREAVGPSTQHPAARHGRHGRTR
eukprot:scaffold60474_cov51-Phaeocystis_antarctica.AAC.2